MTLPDSPLLYETSAAKKRPLLKFVLDALRQQGCRIIYEPPPDIAPFRITFDAPGGERMGIVVYAFNANSRPTKNRPADEHRFQIKYGSDFEGAHEIWQDPYGLYTTVLVGIDPERQFFVAVDPVLHNPTRFSVSVEFKKHDVDEILDRGWWAWERVRREPKSKRDQPLTEETSPTFEVLVGGTAASFLKLIRFEQEALNEAPGERQFLADTFDNILKATTSTVRANAVSIPAARLHNLAAEFELPVDEILDLIAQKRMLKVAVRGHVAEEHLVRTLKRVRGVSDCQRLDIDNGPDVRLVFERRPITIECKTTSRTTTAAGLGKIDFQRTRAAKENPCSRYYERAAFDVVAACTHPFTERWDFLFVRTHDLDAHKTCVGRLSPSVKLDERWSNDPAAVLKAVA